MNTVRLKYNAGTYKPKFLFNKIQSRHDGTNNDVHNNCVKRNTNIFDNPVYHVPKEIITLKKRQIWIVFKYTVQHAYTENFMCTNKSIASLHQNTVYLTNGKMVN